MRLYIKYYIVNNNKLCYDINYILLTYISTTHTHTHTHTYIMIINIKYFIHIWVL
jgi:hypothetical protein